MLVLSVFAFSLHHSVKAVPSHPFFPGLIFRLLSQLSISRENAKRARNGRRKVASSANAVPLGRVPHATTCNAQECWTRLENRLMDWGGGVLGSTINQVIKMGSRLISSLGIPYFDLLYIIFRVAAAATM